MRNRQSATAEPRRSRCAAVAVVPRRPVLVIADDGVRAELLVLRDVCEPDTGGVLEHRGRLWSVTRRRDSSRTLVAEPVGH